MKLTTLIAGGVAAVALAASGAASAALSFAGSWQVDAGPSWTTVPGALTGQETAALLFGGVASDYQISTVDNLTVNIDNQAWATVWFAGSFPDCAGFPCGRKVAENFKLGTGAGGTYANPGDVTTYSQDWAVGSRFTNYAFNGAAVPEPMAWALMIGGFGMVGSTMRRRRTGAATA